MVVQVEPMARLASNKQFVYHLVNRLKVRAARTWTDVCV
jgi:hypothetical protein